MASGAGQTALVTGASAGIGREIATLLAARGFDLVLVARREAELAALAGELERDHGISATPWPLDLLRDDAGERLERGLDERGIAIDLLVNNAGVIEIGPFHELERDRVMRLVRLNALLLAELTHRFVGRMVERGRGRVLNVASLAGFQPVPVLGVYAATKAFALSLTESLSEDLKGTGVTVTALCPGLTQTDMVDQARDANAMAREVPDFLVSGVRDVAEAGVEGCLAGRTIVVPGLPNRLQASLVGMYPRWLVRSLGGWLGRLGR